LIGGFLGAGKTTLVNHLLRTATHRYGVLVNDFGAIAIDAAPIAARDGDTIALTNGCVCCGMSGDLGDGLRSAE
jgi:G3E family GTPase